MFVVLENILKENNSRLPLGMRTWIFFFTLINRKEGKQLIKALIEKLDELIKQVDEMKQETDALHEKAEALYRASEAAL
jgi:Tfp pilus assembly protein PilN